MQLVMEPSVMSLTSQMNLVSFAPVQSNIVIYLQYTVQRVLWWGKIFVASYDQLYYRKFLWVKFFMASKQANTNSTFTSQASQCFLLRVYYTDPTFLKCAVWTHSVVVQTACGWTEEDSGLSELYSCLHRIASSTGMLYNAHGPLN